MKNPREKVVHLDRMNRDSERARRAQTIENDEDVILDQILLKLMFLSFKIFT
jgi:hypothetical protein